ncbi:hypothetical protein FJZ31_33490 [Candidatus Poribacteria bacterium]|nr:hypothetical protein [Candidatus Poribacteria bacterium]
MRAVAICLILSYFLCGVVAVSLRAAAEPSSDLPTQAKIGLEEVLFAPTSFVTATEDDLMISGYLRTTTQEGKAPEDLSKTVDNAERFLNFRLGRWGATLGWLGGGQAKLLEPHILAADYKLSLRDEKDRTAFAVDFKYATQKLPQKTLRQSFLDFGVFSITGIASQELSLIFEPYGGVMANYVYLDASAPKLTSLWKLVPFVGIRLHISPFVQAVFELNRASLDAQDPRLTWHLGGSIRF